MTAMFPEFLLGFEEDFQELLGRFKAAKSPRYNKFVEIWKEMKFSFVYSGRRTKEDIFFSMEVMNYVKRCFTESTEDIVKIGCIYTMYGLYFKQPVIAYSKIYLTMDDWLNFRHYFSVLKTENHLDTLFIALKLVMHDAFEFSICPIKRFSIRQNDNNLPQAPIKPSVNKHSINRILDELAAKDKEYTQAKDSCTDVPKILLSYSKPNFSEIIRDILNRDTQQPPETKASSSDSEASDSQRTKKVKIYRAKNKCKLYKSVVFDSDSESDSSESEDENS